MIRVCTEDSCWSKSFETTLSEVVRLEELRGVIRDVETLKQQVTIHEGLIHDVRLTQAVQGQRITTVEGDLKEIKDNTKRILWLIIGGFVTAVVAFVVGGGLKP